MGSSSLKRQRREEARAQEAARRALEANRPPRDFGRELANWLFPIYLGIVLVGFVGIRSVGLPPGAQQNSVRALFMAINAGTLTGFQASVGVVGLSREGQWILLLLTIAGSLFSMIVGTLAVRRIVGLSFTDRQIVLGALIAEGAGIVLGLPFLWGLEQTWFSSLFFSVSAFGNCGLFDAPSAPRGDFAIHWIIVPLTIAGGLGLPVLLDLWARISFQRPISEHSRATIGMSAWLYVIGVVLLGVCLLSSHEWAVSLRGASVLAVEARTGGMPIEPVDRVGAEGEWILILLMAVGAGSGGTGGGLKVTTVAELIKGTRKLLRGESPGRVMGVAIAWLGIYLGIVLVGVILFSYVRVGSGAQSVLFDAVSAASNVGFSTAQIPDLKNVMFAYSAIMLLGRMTPLMILWWMVESRTEGEWAIG